MIATGFFHILDLNGLDHLLFLTVLGVVYTFKQWKELLWVLTAFTIAHSLTLALAIFDVYVLDRNLVEFLIPITILATCIENIFFVTNANKYRIIFAGIFGLIHGMGFSSLLKELFSGMDYNPWLSLLPFNIGLELAQIVVVFILMLLVSIINKIKFIKQEYTIKVTSVLIAIQSSIWIVERFPF